MSPRTKYVIGGVVAAIILYWLLPGWLFALAVIGLIAIPVVGYLMLDPSQRRRLRGQGRKRLG
jgi:membrane protein implicated in regulation of membrane protease activity